MQSRVIVAVSLMSTILSVGAPYWQSDQAVQAASTHEPAKSTPSGTVTIIEPDTIDNLDPLITRSTIGIDASRTVFDSLVRQTGDGVFHRDLAIAWSHSANNKMWTFTLSPTAHWQDGELVTPDDVAFTVELERQADFRASSTLGFTHIVSQTILNAHSIQFQLDTAYTPFLATVGSTAIMPKHLLGTETAAQIRNDINLNKRPVGSGPYAISQVTASGTIIETANRDYFGSPARINQLVFVPKTSRAGQVSALASTPNALIPTTVGLTARDSSVFINATNVTLLYSPSFSWTHIDLIEHGLFANGDVRRALAFVTPRAALVAQVLQGHGQVADSDQSPTSLDYNPALKTAYPFNPVKAARLLARVGLKKLKSGSLVYNNQIFAITLWVDRSCVSCIQAGQLVAQAWRSIGISTTVSEAPTTILFGPRGPLYNPGRFAQARYDAALYAWVNGSDPDDSAYWASSSLVTAKNELTGNFTGYADKNVDRLIAKALGTPPGHHRMLLYRQIQSLLSRDQPSLFLYWTDQLSVMPTALHGYAPTPYEKAATWNAGSWVLGA